MLAAEVDNSQVPETKQNKNVFLARITTSEDVGGGVTMLRAVGQGHRTCPPLCL